MRSKLAYLFLSTWIVASAVPAEELEQLGEAFADETRQLEVDIEEYAKARQWERQALAELRRVNEILDDKLSDPSTSPANLRRLELQIESARLEAFDLSEKSAAARLGMYERMERVGQILDGFEREGVDIVPAGGGVTGTWKLTVPEYEVAGVMSLLQEGSLISGSYRMSTGAQGSVQGTFAGSRLELDLVDSARGMMGSSAGELDPASGDIRGTWHPLELASGEPSRVEWRAHRVRVKDLFNRP